MSVFRVEISATNPANQVEIVDTEALVAAGLGGLKAIYTSRLFFIEGDLGRDAVMRIATEFLADPVTETASVLGESDKCPHPPEGTACEVHLRPGVMDPVAESTLAELRNMGYAVTGVRTARRYVLHGDVDVDGVRCAAGRVLANDCIEEVFIGTAGVRPAPSPPQRPFETRRVALRGLGVEDLAALSRRGHLFLALEEMRAVQAHFAALGRNPTDLELETIAQTWSEHCVHKTLRAPVVYRGDPIPDAGELRRGPAGAALTTGSSAGGSISLRYENLLRETIVRATERVVESGRGPRCLSVFQDNAGVIEFDERFGVAFKVETHNHPSAIEPYGGASTGVGGCIRDVIGCGLGAEPIANTDVFCVAPRDWPEARLPRGVLHPRRVLREVVRGVADYGNRMGIPTVNGAVCFDPRYLGNPLVYCGCVGLIPRDRIAKGARAGDLIVLIGGRTGRDGIHGATFSSAELSGGHADEFSHAVQIGNAITQKRLLDAVLRARNDGGACLYSAITDCGAGGLSSAVGEMAATVGAVVDLERVPLKYSGLRYDEIWISEAQERMVLAVPPGSLDALMTIMREEETEATVIGAFGSGAATARLDRPPTLVVRYRGEVVGELDLGFLHEGLPRRERVAEWRALESTGSRAGAPPGSSAPDPLTRLLAVLRSPSVASKEWIVRRYDHEVRGATIIKPLMGRGPGPCDAAVLRPVARHQGGVAIGCGITPRLADVDPYWMALAAVDEALRNVVCVGGDPRRTAILDNFCWGRTDDPRQLGALVRACQGCHDAAVVYGLPFISGKDSLNNEFALEPTDIDDLLDVMRRRDDVSGDAFASIAAEVRRTGRLSVPGTLLISALSLVADVRKCLSADLKPERGTLLLLGGYSPVGFALAATLGVHEVVADLQRRGLLRACHDASEGGWLTALAEMAIGGARGADVEDAALAVDPFEELVAGYVVQTPDADAVQAAARGRGVRCAALGSVRGDANFRVAGRSVEVGALLSAWGG